ELKWEILPRSTDIDPNDHHLFRSLQNFLNGKKKRKKIDSISRRSERLSSKDETFLARGINNLPER
ncbi:hypothetical protein WN51_04623, partial [Melipona quadrifasciata]